MPGPFDDFDFKALGKVYETQHGIVEFANEPTPDRD